MEIAELREERTVEIEVSSVLQSTPFVRPPDFLLVDFERRIRRIHGNDRLPSEVARASEYIPLVPPREATLLAAVGAEGGKRNQFLLPCDDRCDPLQKGDVGGIDREGGCAVTTDDVHTITLGFPCRSPKPGDFFVIINPT